MSKKGRVTGKRLGSAIITAKYKGKKYRCRVQICSDIDEDKIEIKCSNTIFTKKVYQKTVQIEKDGHMIVNDKKSNESNIQLSGIFKANRI